MLVTMMKSKIHKATVTEANLGYMGSITIDRELMDAAGILTGEKVQIVNNHNGARFETYTISGEPGSGILCLNGAAARLVQPGDEVIIIAYGLMEEKEAKTYHGKVVFVDKENKPMQILEKEAPRVLV